MPKIAIKHDKIRPKGKKISNGFSSHYSMAVYIILNDDLNKINCIKLDSNDRIIINKYKRYVSPLNELLIEKEASKYISYYPNELYCGLTRIYLSRDEPYLGRRIKYKEKQIKIDKNKSNYIDLHILSKGKYIVTEKGFIFTTGSAFSAESRSPKFGWFFEVE